MWLAGDVVDRVGIYGYMVVDGFLVFNIGLV